MSKLYEIDPVNFEKAGSTQIAMMNNEREQWIDKVLNSMTDAQRASPDQNLKYRIEQEIHSEEIELVSPLRWRISAAAAILLLIINIYAISNYGSSGNKGALLTGASVYSDISLLSTYDIYEE